ncbi:MAG TPA: site-specific DNA-methyltransferase [Stellaceae bacterium]|jgi:adenine-specific DNA-methyltransferase
MSITPPSPSVKWKTRDRDLVADAISRRGVSRRKARMIEVAAEDITVSDVVMACQDNITFMRSWPRQSMHLIVTSPPYNIGKTYEARSSLDAYLQAQIPVIDECVRLLHPRGSLCWQVGNHVDKGEIIPLDIVLYPLFQSHGLKLRNRIVWHFEHGLHCSKRLSGRYETILWFTRGDDYAFNLDPIRVPSKYPGKKYFKGPKAGQISCNPLGKNPSDVWIFPNVKNNHIEKTIHPCQFPVELVERLVLALTKPGHKVLDPYMGVGTSIVAAFRHGRLAYGCDIVPEYVNIARQRLRQLSAGTLKTRPMDRPVYDPAKPNGGHRNLNAILPLFPVAEP